VGRVDLHVHSTASDGECAPADIARRAAAAGLAAVALTDHDTITGCVEAEAAGRECGIRLVMGCEFSVRAPWGELHLLGYLLPAGAPALDRFLAAQRSRRAERMEEIVRRLDGAGVAIELDEVVRTAGGGALGRPHAARALVAAGVVAGIGEAFDKYLGNGRPACVPKALPEIREVTALVRDLGGVTSAAHLKDRASAGVLRRLRDDGVDAVEARHPSHDDVVRTRIEGLAETTDLLVTGGSDFHADATAADPGRVPIGGVEVPIAWLERMDELHAGRRSAEVTS
jgi:predicted metal-dependent phosphoesterase TrpH